MAKSTLLNQEIAPVQQMAVAQVPKPSTAVVKPTTPTTPVKADEPKANENFLSKNKNLLLLGVVLVGGYFLYKNKMK